MLNKLNMEYRAMRNASDPVLRQKAEALSYLGMTVYGMATYYAMNDKITGYKTKDRKHRFSYKYQDEKWGRPICIIIKILSVIYTIYGNCGNKRFYRGLR